PTGRSASQRRRRYAAAARPRAPVASRCGCRLRSWEAPGGRLSREYASVSVCLYGETSGARARGTVPLGHQYSLRRNAASRGARTRHMTHPTERFSDRAEHYRRHRPGYPAAAIEMLGRQCGLTSSAVVADVGSGTGILSEQLLERGARVIGIEPNDAMRAAA